MWVFHQLPSVIKIKCEPVSVTGYRFIFALVCFCNEVFLVVLQKQTNDN